MNKRLIIMLAVLLASTFVLTACKKTATEKILEEGMENAIGQDANVDVNDDTVTIEVGDGTMQAGDDLKLPNDWPKDIYITDGKISSVSNMNNSDSITIVSNKSVEDLKKEYKDKLADDGWEETMSMSLEGSVIVGADKDNRKMSLSITTEDGESTVVIVVNNFEQ